jgi:hypothetical protein
MYILNAFKGAIKLKFTSSFYLILNVKYKPLLFEIDYVSGTPS